MASGVLGPCCAVEVYWAPTVGQALSWALKLQRGVRQPGEDRDAFQASSSMREGAEQGGVGGSGSPEEGHVAQSKRSDILTSEHLDWDTGFTLLSPSPPPTHLPLVGVGEPLLSRQRASSGRQKMHSRVRVKRQQCPQPGGAKTLSGSSCSQPPAATWNGFGLQECSARSTFPGPTSPPPTPPPSAQPCCLWVQLLQDWRRGGKQQERVEGGSRRPAGAKAGSRGRAACKQLIGISKKELEGTSHLLSLDPGWAGGYSHSHFTDEKTESQKSSVACPRCPSSK